MPPPGSWFYKLRRKRGDAGEITRGDRAPAVVTTPSSSASSRGVPVPPPCTPNRASYYVPSGERGAIKGIPIPPKRRDTQFPRSPQPNDIVFDVVTVSRAAADRFDGLGAMPELKLRPILTKPAGKKADGEEEASGSGSASPTARARRRRRPRLYVKPSGGRKGRRPADAQPPATANTMPQRRRARRRRWLQESLVVVKESADPEEDFLASMAEMIAANDDVRASPRGLEELLACYLALNAAEHHRAIVAAFRRAWLDDAPGNTAKHRPPPSQGLAS